MVSNKENTEKHGLLWITLENASAGARPQLRSRNKNRNIMKVKLLKEACVYMNPLKYYKLTFYKSNK